jgi:hypothetical protein
LVGTTRRLPLAALALLALLALAGCHRPAPERRPAFADLAAVERLHPQWPRLRELDLELAGARRQAVAKASPAAGEPGQVLASEAAVEPAGEPAGEPEGGPETASDDGLAAARERARGELRADGELAAALARDEVEATYLDDLRRLRLEVRGAVEPPPALDLDGYEQAVREVGEEMARLELQLHVLRPSPATDRYFYRPEQLRRRAELYTQTQRELKELKAKRLAQLAARLAPPAEERPVEVPPARLAELARDREARAARAAADLARRQEEAAAALESTPRWAALPLPGPLALAPEPEAADRMPEVAARLGEAAKAGPERRAALLAALARLQQERALLARRLRDETAAVAGNQARDLGFELQPRPARGLPDLTARVAARVRAYYQASNPGWRP